MGPRFGDKADVTGSDGRLPFLPLGCPPRPLFPSLPSSFFLPAAAADTCAGSQEQRQTARCLATSPGEVLAWLSPSPSPMMLCASWP